MAHVAVSGKGYRLERPLELFEEHKILSHVDARVHHLIKSLERYDRILSTNTHLMQRAAENAPSGSVCLTEQQTAGKGRRGRNWVSPFGKNIYLSILWRFQSGSRTVSGLSLAIGVAVIRALNSLFPYSFELKWPNDIYYQGKKLGGILVEVSGESDGPCAAVVGIGLNIYLSQTEAVSITQSWTDLSQITGGQTIGRNLLAGTLLSQLLQVLAGFEENGINGYLDEWRRYDCLKDKPAILYIGERSYEGIVKGIDDKGLILLARPDGITQSFGSGEVSFNNSQ